MISFCLQLNPGKTQEIIIGPTNILNMIDIGGIILPGNVCIRFVSTVKNLGITFDTRLSFVSQITALKRDSFRLIRNIVKKRFIFSNDQMKMVVNSIVACRLDYCNALYFGISEHLINQLQLIQNAAAKAVVGLYKYDHMGETLKELHWLPVKYRIEFKILLIIFKCLIGSGLII